MNFKIFFLLVFVFIAVFISGFFVSTYDLFPISSLKSLYIDNYSENPIFENDVNSLIRVVDISSKNEIKQNFIKHIWKQKIPTTSESLIIENNIIDTRYSNLQNLNSIDKLTIEMEYGVNSIAYHFTPIENNGKLIIYHQGHRGDFFEGKNTIEYFLKHNFSVVAFSMPLVGMNSQPIIEHPTFGNFKIQSHNQLEFLESEDFSPIKFFVEPIIVVMNYFDNDYDFNSYHMVGISGGGWTTVIVSAIDERIVESYSIAGSYPIFLRSAPENVGDYEQHNSDLYEIANYLDLYVMASTGQDRKFIQIFNKYDPCCFSGTSFDAYEENIKNIVSNIGTGYFDIFLDDTHKEHIISENSLEIIINEIKN
ncbi:hypothetical protein OAJ08_02150 [Candidatus Nitrosopelagicus sp.]|nr:hypothetical protein [Candidatus Nitrosopelagicus sp.]